MIVRGSILSTVCALSLAACSTERSTATEPTPPRSSSSSETTRGVRVAVVRYDPPADPFFDLGPVFVEEVSDRETLQQRLQLEADRLGADGFIVESQSLESIYLVEGAQQQLTPPGEATDSPRGPTPRGASDIGPVQEPAGGALLAMFLVATELIAHGEVRGPKLVATKTAYLRAYRLQSRGTAPVLFEADGLDLPAPLFESIRVASTLGDQLHVLTAALVRGEIAPRVYQKARDRLLSSAPA